MSCPICFIIMFCLDENAQIMYEMLYFCYYCNNVMILYYNVDWYPINLCVINKVF